MWRDFIALYKAHQHSRSEWAPKDALLGRDRREFHRIMVRVACRINSQLFGLESAATIVNLSMGGIGLFAPVSWPEGSEVRVWIDEYGIDVDGIVSFRVDAQGEFRYGVKFRRLGWRRLLRIRQILRERYQGPLIIR